MAQSWLMPSSNSRHFAGKALSDVDKGGGGRQSWIPLAGMVAAIALLVSFYGVVDGAVRHAERVQRDARGPAAVAPHARLHASL